MTSAMTSGMTLGMTFGMTEAGAAIAFVAPSGFLPDPSTIDRSARFFTRRGWRVQSGDSCFERHLRFAGPDELRCTELQRFATDRNIDVVMAARGGYGLTRFLDRLDFAAIRRAERFIVGYSDFTAFNLALLARAGGTSWQGPSSVDFAAESPDEYTVGHFFGVLQGGRHTVEFAAEGSPDCEARGTLWGGNLALVCALLGTPYMPRSRGILFLEDVNEPAYCIERMLLQLLQAGVLARQRAVLLGAFAPVPPQANDNGFDLAQVVAHLRAVCATPIVSGLPFGHVPRKATVPVGKAARLAVASGSARLEFQGA
jgi:muramoyltetrapeptide carboxypeptidase